MRVCAVTNLFTASGLVLALAFAGCGSSGTGAEPAPAAPTAPTTETTASSDAPPDMFDDEAVSDTADTSEGDTQQNTGGHKAASGSKTTCPLDGSSGDEAPKLAKVDGKPRDVNTIQAIVLTYRGCVRRCYEKGREKLPTLQGDMTIKFTVSPKGKLKEAAVNTDRSDIFAPMVVDCAIDVLKQLDYGKSEKGMETTVNYPFNFKP